MAQPILTRNLKVFDYTTGANTSRDSSAIDISDCTIIGVQVITTGAAGATAGSVKLQASCDSGTTWSDIGTALSVPAAFTNGVISLADVPYPLVRVAFTALTGGTPALTSLKVYVSTKQPA